ncbi:MAG: hypothetical protein M1830_009562 [Pleopsidium flavum]|nr:MAG: hypothetical protein M1830_009562 [Pleopsidium flavum]
MALIERFFELSKEIPDVPCPSRPVIEILDFVEEVTCSPFEHLTIQDPRDSSGAFPFRALLDFVEASCENPLQNLVILNSEELREYKIKTTQLIQESYSAAFTEHFDPLFRQTNPSQYLHHRIFELQAELSNVSATLKERETELAVLGSALNQQTRGSYYGPKSADSEIVSDTVLAHKRQRPSQPTQHYGFDGVDERMLDSPDRHLNVPASSHDSRRSRIPIQHPPPGLPPVPVSRQEGSDFDDRAAVTQPRPGSTSAVFGHTSWAATKTSPRSAFHRISMPPPSKHRSYAPGLALRKPKVDEYDPLGRLVPGDEYTLLRDKYDVELRGAWTTIEPENQTRNWDKLRKVERSQSGSAKSFSSRDPWSRWNTTSAGTSDLGSDLAGWATPQGEGDRISPPNTSVDPRFEDPELDVDPEVRAQFRGIAELLQPQIGPQSAFEQRNKNVLSHNASAPIKVIIGGQVVKTLNRRSDNRGELRDRDGDYIDGQNRGLMKKHLEEDRKRLIQERDEQLIRATQEKRAWDAMDSGELEARLAKRASNRFARLGAGVGGQTDTFETDEIPDVYIRKVTARSIAAWSEISTSRPSSSLADHEDYIRPVQDDETLSLSASDNLTRQPAQLERSYARSQSDRSYTSGRIAVDTINRASSISAASTATETTQSIVDQGPQLAPLQDTLFDLTKFRDEAAAEKFDLTQAASGRRGRVATVTLHHGVAYSTSAIAERLFGGFIQEIQFFPEARQALVIFVHPVDAAAFVQHIQSVKMKSLEDYRRLQINAEFYRGVESEAVYPAQKYILAAVIAAEASRSILLRGLPTTLSLNEFAQHMKLRLSKILVKVTLVKQRNSFTRKRDGNIGILDFASIRDAVEVTEAFRSKKVSDFTQCTAEWLPDPCCKGPSKKDYCRCMHCYESELI